MRTATSCGRRSSGAISAPKRNAAGSTETIGADAAARADVESRAHQLHADQAAVGPRARTGYLAARAHVLLPKDYVRFRLSGEYATDVADASGTLMLDVAQRRWSDEMLDAADHRRAMLPDVFESPSLRARLGAGAQRRRTRRKGRRSSRARAIRPLARSAWASLGPARSAPRSARRASSLPRRIVPRSIRRAASTRSVTRFPDAGT